MNSQVFTKIENQFGSYDPKAVYVFKTDGSIEKHTKIIELEDYYRLLEHDYYGRMFLKKSDIFAVDIMYPNEGFSTKNINDLPVNKHWPEIKGNFLVASNYYTIHSCQECGKYAKHKCGGCKSVYYCGSECQKLGWKYHKESCV